jgi:carbonic anhydrase
MDASYEKLLTGNRTWVARKRAEDPEFFARLAQGQEPQYVWIGCSDSRLHANEVTGTEAGEIFVHRNVANQVFQTDMNLLSVLYYAVEILRVKHVLVVGHYGCGGIRAGMKREDQGFVNNWLRGVKEVCAKHSRELDALPVDRRADRLAELNVIEQVDNLTKTRVLQRAWSKRDLQLHGWVFDHRTGHITELVNRERFEGIDPVFAYENPAPATGA